WHLRYPIEGRPGEFIVVATTRPETMLGDTAVAVHPDDERYKHLVGQNVILPLIGRRMPIIADEYSDPEKGSGAVKITPAHDFNDFEVGKRHGLPMVNIMGPEGKLLLDPNPDFTRGIDDSPELKAMVLEFNGVFRFAARKLIVHQLEAQGLMEKIEPHVHTVPHGDRSNAVIEPRLTDQWYVDAATLAKPAIDAVKRGRTVFVPKNWETTYFHWMENIQPWCISRQLWWGHQIPAWYGPDGKVFVAEDEAGAHALAKDHYGKAVELERDEDVLDTWFSSALWPFSTLGWPDKTSELARYYPTDVLITGFDIIFFWVARMMMMGLQFMEEVPFRDVYIHALVRDEKGQKMSKSKGNVIDPLDLIGIYGADALRFTLAAMAAQGRDIKLSSARVEGYRNFATKLWNAARFAEMNGCVTVPGFDPAGAKETLNRWIAGESERTARAVTEALEAFRFNEAAGAIYHFIWHVYCDWYLELIKPILAGSDADAAAETRAMAAFVLDQALLLLHPFMPFVTEELWAKLGSEAVGRDSLLMLAPWPEPRGLENVEADAEIGWLIKLISEVRSVRSEMNVPAGAKVPLLIAGAGDETRARVARHGETIKRLARLDGLDFGKPPHGAVQIVLDESVLALPLAGIIDIGAESQRLKREIDQVGSEIKQLDAKLANEKFV
ncbi:MAG TPA: valine--tRNA ligase, partial [Methyloceanibacter sp.]